MKRSRTNSKSTESIGPSGKDDPPPPKKISKKRVKSITQSTTPQAHSNSQSPSLPSTQPTPVILKPSNPPNSASKLGSLPMYGEHIPEKGYPAIPKQAESVCSDLRLIMTMIRDIKSKGGSGMEAEMEVCKQNGLVYFVALKKLNRLSHMYCKDTREQTHEQKLGVDDLHLQLQNLMYEAMHLRKEITNCLEFKSRHEEIDLIAEDELPSSMHKNVDKHQIMLKRLESELVQRKQLAEQQSMLESSIANEEGDIKIAEDNLSSILPTLEGIRKATLPLQEALGITLDKRREEQEMALLLPSSLYIFFMQAKAYSDVHDSSLTVTVSGDMGEAKTLQSNHQNNSDDESGDSDGEGGEKEHKKKHRKREKSSSENRISKAHPLSIICTVTLKDLGSVQVIFSYLPHFSAVCASVSSVTMDGLSDDQLSIHLDKSSLLHCLTDGDTGRTSPNAVVSFHIRKHKKEVFSSAVRMCGLPYKWVQRVCGISDSVEIPDNSSPEQQVEISAENLAFIVSRIKLKLKSQVYLMKQTVSLSSDDHKMILGPDADVLFPQVAICKLIKWKQLSLAEMQSAITQFSSQSIFNQQERTNKFYLGIFQHGGAHLKCIACVGADYPYTPPIVAIMVEDSGEKKLVNIQIKNIEADINVHFPNSVKESDATGQYLLCQQLQRLQSCFDMYMEYKKSPGNRRAQTNRIRGKGRLLILEDKNTE